MKKHFIALVPLFLMYHGAFAQWVNNYTVFSTSGSAGIGTNTPSSPLSLGTATINKKLFIYDAAHEASDFEQGNSEFRIYGVSSAINHPGFGKYQLTTDSFTEQTRIDNGGSVSIGTAQTKTVTADANDALNSNSKIVAQTSVGQVFFTGHQLGTGYAFPSAGIFRAWTDNPVGASNYFYDGVTNGNVNSSVRTDGKGYFAGKMGIGTTTPFVSLEVNGSIFGGNTKLDGFNTNFLANSGKVLIGWNRTAGAGETDFITNQGPGNTGGFAFYNHDNSNTEKQLMWLKGDGRLIDPRAFCK